MQSIAGSPRQGEAVFVNFWFLEFPIAFSVWLFFITAPVGR